MDYVFSKVNVLKLKNFYGTGLLTILVKFWIVKFLQFNILMFYIGIQLSLRMLLRIFLSNYGSYLTAKFSSFRGNFFRTKKNVRFVDFLRDLLKNFLQIFREALTSKFSFLFVDLLCYF